MNSGFPQPSRSKLRHGHLQGYAVTVTINSARIAAERDKAKEVSAFLENLFQTPDPYSASASDRADTLRVRDFLDRGSAMVREGLSTRPLVQAHMMLVLGNVYRNLGLFEQARPLLQEALEVRRRLHGPEHLEVAESLHSLAMLEYDLSEFDAAEGDFREALRIQRATDTKRTATALTLTQLASLLRDESNFIEAEGMLREALGILGRRLGDEHRDVAESLVQLGRVLHDKGDLDGAEPMYREALDLHRKRYGNDHPELTQSLENLGILLREKGELGEAEPLLRESLAIRRRMLGDAHPHTASSMYELASLLRDKGDLAEAALLFRQVTDLDRKQLGSEHQHVGMDLMELGITLNKLQRYDDALVAYQEALSILRRASPDHQHISAVLTGLGYTHVLRGEPADGEPMLREALRIRQDALGDGAWRTGVSKSTLGECLMKQNRFDEAESLLVDGYTTRRDGSGPPRAAVSPRISFYEATNRLEEAVQHRILLAESEF